MEYSTLQRADCPVYRPTMAEMSESMERFIQKIEPESSPCGICKIVPLSPWKACDYVGQDLDTSIGRIDQKFTRDTTMSGSRFYFGAMTPMRKQTVREFRQQAEKAEMSPSTHRKIEDLAGLERAYWTGIPERTIYGADNEGSLFDREIKVHYLTCREFALSACTGLKVVVAAGVEPSHLGLLPGPRPCVRPLRTQVEGSEHPLPVLWAVESHLCMVNLTSFGQLQSLSCTVVEPDLP